MISKLVGIIITAVVIFSFSLLIIPMIGIIIGVIGEMLK